ncbi:hypothetical protein CHS0354_016074 [Potamilus streckersoni]|uniref:Haloacid dehalogenase-like hydrolase domain-containing 5 n=1 Tax=Potamilus streckersoni TaxID=2493646 RepID=A0AAE0T0U1_9BIVA|nr:hypothetical protein CHS0354_016074 [Potamilus streckersoni]
MRDLLQATTYRSDDGQSTDTSDGNGDISMINQEQPPQNNEPDFGILFDVDGVLARGSTPLSAAIQAVRLLQDSQGNLKVPVAFVTNACNRSFDKAKQIKDWLKIEVTPDMVIHAPTPARMLKEYHHKHVLVIGQEHRKEIAEDLGFVNTCTIEDVQEAYPLLDMVDHEHRNVVAKGIFQDDPNFPRIEAILLIGEPILWETHLQLLIDLLLTEGKPSNPPVSLSEVKQLPVIACNMDLVFMHQACMPRFGHGAFLVCLEALYKKITGKEMEYTALIGKPCEITYRYAEHVINDVAKRIGITRTIQKLYFIGDNPNVDIVGANLYDRYLKEIWQHRDNGNTPVSSLPLSRSIPDESDLYEQTVRSIKSLLVGTGVYKHDTEKTATDDDRDVYHGHRDIANEPELTTPSKFVPDVQHGIRHIFEVENYCPVST